MRCVRSPFSPGIERHLPSCAAPRNSAPVAAEEIAGPPLRDVAFRSVPELIAQRAAEEPARAAVRCRAPSGKWQDLSWGALDQRRRAAAAGLASLGVKPGEVVAFVGQNSAAMLVAELAAQTLGAA